MFSDNLLKIFAWINFIEMSYGGHAAKAHHGEKARLPARLLVPAECPLLFCVLYNLLLHTKPLALPHSIHVLAGLVLGVGLLPEVQVLLLRGGHPEGVTGDDL